MCEGQHFMGNLQDKGMIGRQQFSKPMSCLIMLRMRAFQGPAGKQLWI